MSWTKLFHTKAASHFMLCKVEFAEKNSLKPKNNAMIVFEIRTAQ